MTDQTITLKPTSAGLDQMTVAYDGKQKIIDIK